MYHIMAENMQSNSFSIPVQLRNNTNQNIEALSLIDSGQEENSSIKTTFGNLGLKFRNWNDP